MPDGFDKIFLLNATLYLQCVTGEAQGFIYWLARRGERALFARDVLGRTRGPLSDLLNFTSRKGGDKGAGSSAEQRALFTGVLYMLSPVFPRGLFGGIGRRRGEEGRCRFQLEIRGLPMGPGASARRLAPTTKIALFRSGALVGRRKS